MLPPPIFSGPQRILAKSPMPRLMIFPLIGWGPEGQTMVKLWQNQAIWRQRNQFWEATSGTMPVPFKAGDSFDIGRHPRKMHRSCSNGFEHEKGTQQIPKKFQRCWCAIYVSHQKFTTFCLYPIVSPSLDAPNSPVLSSELPGPSCPWCRANGEGPPGSISLKPCQKFNTLERYCKCDSYTYQLVNKITHTIRPCGRTNFSLAAAVYCRVDKHPILALSSRNWSTSQTWGRAPIDGHFIRF